MPNFDSLMQLCNGMLVTPLDFFTTNSLSSRDMPQFVLDRLPILSSGKGKPVTEDDVQRMRQVLEMVLEVEEENPFPFPDLHQVAQRIGYHVETLCKHCPDLCHAIVTRYRRSWSGDDTRRRMRQALENALASDERLPLEAVARQLGCSRSVLYQHFPELSRSVGTRYRERFDQERIRQRLQEVLSSSEKMPEMRELTGHFGCTHQFLENNFSDLCKQIALRRRTELRKQREERVTRTSTEIHQTVMLLHQQGIYPSSVQVTKQLNKPRMLWKKEGREAWLLALEELGYPTSHIKRYT